MERMELPTRRLLLREYRPGDRDAVHALASDPVVCVFAEWGPNTPQETAAFPEDCASGQGTVPRQEWTLAVTSHGLVIGSVALMRGIGPGAGTR